MIRHFWGFGLLLLVTAAIMSGLVYSFMKSGMPIHMQIFMLLFTICMGSPLAWLIFSESWDGYRDQQKKDQLREFLVMRAEYPIREVQRMSLFRLEIEAEKRGLV